jgi:hypothetical protein
MKRKTKIIRNRIRCKVCGEVLESKYTHDFVPCKCYRESGGSKGCVCDGGNEYLRRLFEYEGIYEDLSETRPYTDEERDAYNRHRELLAEQYGWMKIDYME